MEWYRLAARLGMPLQQCQRQTTSTEFKEWQEFFKRELEMPRREDYYAAQNAAEIRRTVAKNPKDVRLEHFLLEFDTTRRKRVDAEEEQAARVARSKAAWGAIAQNITKK